MSRRIRWRTNWLCTNVPDRFRMEKLYGYRENQNTWGMDQFIGEPTYWNRGIGTELVQTALTYIINELGAEAIAMDPKVSNERAIRCYEKCRFRKIKILKKHELHEGVLEDCWMMEYKVKL